MSEQNKKEFQTPYEEYRVKAGYTRESASEELNGISPDKIYRIEKGKQTAAPDIVLQLADLYHAPELCNYHCTHKCEIGQKYIPQVDVQDLPSIILSTVATLNDIQPLVNRLIQITMDGKISDDEIPDFALISTKLDEISTASDVLRLWIEKTIQVNKLNGTLFYEEVDKLKKKKANSILNLLFNILFKIRDFKTLIQILYIKIGKLIIKIIHHVF